MGTSETQLARPPATKAASARDVTQEVAEQNQYLTFLLGDEMFAIGILSIREIIEYGFVTDVPMTPPFIRGVLNLRGAVVPVVDLGARLELAATDVGRRTCVVIVDVPGIDDGRPQTLGLLVDAVYEVFDAPATTLEKCPGWEH